MEDNQLPPTAPSNESKEEGPRKPKFKIGDKVLYKPPFNTPPENLKELCIKGLGSTLKKVPLEFAEHYWDGTYYCIWIDDERKIGSFYREELLEKIGTC